MHTLNATSCHALPSAWSSRAAQAEAGQRTTQARRLECRLRTPKMAAVEPKKEHVHMLNATLTATERTLCCLLENYQTPDGVRCARPKGRLMRAAVSLLAVSDS